MKLTKQKLEQLIMEEYVRRIGDENKPTNRPEYADKLTTLAKDDYNQAASLADSLDEPLDIEFDPNNMDYFPIDSEFGKYLQGPEHELHFDFPFTIFGIITRRWTRSPMLIIILEI